MDLFASHLNHQHPIWFCRTIHPLAAASNALSQSWTRLSVYGYPPIPLLERTLIKIREDQAEEAIVIAPQWPRRSWYHLLLQMTCEIPLLFTRWCGERGENPVSTPSKHVLDFFQLKAETLSVNTLKGYVTAISHRHATVRGEPPSMDPSIRRWIKGL